MPKTEFFTTIENQVRPDGSRGLLYDHFDSLEQAEAKYFTICAAAATSGIPYHAAFIIHSDGSVIYQKVYDRRTEQVEETEE